MTHRGLSLLIAFAAVLLALFVWSSPEQNALAAPPAQETPPGGSEQLSIGDNVCLGCHGQPGQTMPLRDGSNLELYVPAEAYNQSIHGELGYACVQCHTTVGNYPHPAFSATDLREVSLKLSETCKRCHAHQYELSQDSVHAAALAGGNRASAVCVDCHTAHDVRRLNDPKTHTLLPEARTWIPTTCARCHSTIYEKYKGSVHGAALMGKGNPDVPTCIDCHGVHNIPDPTTNHFRLKSPQMCAKCHTDAKVVGKYGLSTAVMETYVADFHGTTVELFEKQSPDAETNKPVCYDCHGIHDIVSTADPQKGLQVRQNLLARCQVCHPDASDSFPAAWTSHYIPSPDKNPAIYYVNLFYQFFIPGVLGGMALLVVMDFSRATWNRFRPSPRKIEHAEVEELPGEQAPTPITEESPPQSPNEEPPDTAGGEELPGAQASAAQNEVFAEAGAETDEADVMSQQDEPPAVLDIDLTKSPGPETE